MIDGIGPRTTGTTEGLRTQASQRGAPAARLAASDPAAASAPVQSAAAEMAAAGAPVDAAKVAAIRTAIAEGRYPVDPQAIAAKMIALDLDGGAA